MSQIDFDRCKKRFVFEAEREISALFVVSFHFVVVDNCGIIYTIIEFQFDVDQYDSFNVIEINAILLMFG
jgi:hypothetical protein